MSAFRQGKWRIQSVIVNSETVVNNEGFLRLEVEGIELAIQPAGFRFKIQQSTARSAVLESRGQVYFADFNCEDDVLQLNLSRPGLSETIQITAEFDDESETERLASRRVDASQISI